MDYKIISFAFVVLVVGRATVAGMLDLQPEIDDVAACGGGVVRVATGEREVRPFVLRSNVTLELAEGAVLLASTNIADYAAALGERCFVGAEGATNIAIVGRGVIDGRGVPRDRRAKRREPAAGASCADAIYAVPRSST